MLPAELSTTLPENVPFRAPIMRIGWSFSAWWAPSHTSTDSMGCAFDSLTPAAGPGRVASPWPDAARSLAPTTPACGQGVGLPRQFTLPISAVTTRLRTGAAWISTPSTLIPFRSAFEGISTRSARVRVGLLGSLPTDRLTMKVGEETFTLANATGVHRVRFQEVPLARPPAAGKTTLGFALVAREGKLGERPAPDKYENRLRVSSASLVIER